VVSIEIGVMLGDVDGAGFGGVGMGVGVDADVGVGVVDDKLVLLNVSVPFSRTVSLVLFRTPTRGIMFTGNSYSFVELV